MDNSIAKRRLNAGNFVVNNGIVLRTINILRYKYNKLVGVQRAVIDSGIEEDEFLDSINFLAAEDYIHLRNVGSHVDAALSEIDYKEIEAKVTARGIRLLAGGIDDKMIEV